MASQSSNTYFAADTPERLVEYLSRKSQSWSTSITSNNYLDKMLDSWMWYHGFFYQDGHKVSFGGEQGEQVQLAINHYRNIAKHTLNMVTASRPAFQARSINSDYKSQIQTELANGLLDYYMREKRLERYLKRAVEYAIVLGSGFIKIDWNATAGEIYDYIEPAVDEIDPVTGKKREPYPVYEGEAVFQNLSPLDVLFDNSKETYDDNIWVLVRTFKNKYDLIAKYPDLADKILSLKTKNDMSRRRVTFNPFDETTDVPVYEFYHKRTESVPNGRLVVYLEKDIVLTDTIMPYRALPIYRIAPGDILGTPFGYTDMWDLIPIQETINSLYSTVATNQNAFGVQNILNPRGNDIRVNQIEGGLNFIDYSPVPGSPSGGRPEALNLTQTPKEIFDFIGMLEKAQETVSGVNAVARGDSVAGIKSGTALALIQSQSLQFMSGLQQSYIQLIEDVGTGLINILKDFASTPRIAAISGISNRVKIKEFTGEDLNSINRVIVDVGNALANCLGKDTPILMIDGSIKPVQDVTVGDKVMGPDSKPRTVQNVNSGTEMMYKISSISKLRNIEYICNESHILTLRYCSDDYRYNAKKGDILDITVRDFLKLPNRHQRLLQGFTTGVEYEEKEVIIPSYILGAWLGDGTSASTAITSMDSEIVEEWTKCATKFGLTVRVQENKQPNKSKVYFMTSGKANGYSNRNPVMNELRRLDLINNKHIPNLYLINSEKERLELLAGLLDTDGSRVDNTFVFTQKSDVLANQVVTLAKSLGFRVTIKKIEVAIGHGYTTKPSNTNKITIGGDTYRIPVRLPRKMTVKVDRNSNWLNYGIKVDKLEEGTFYGFTLREEPHFVMGDFSVTHNTTAGKVQMAEQLLQMKIITTPEQYLQVMNTGNLQPMMESSDNKLTLIKRENEALLEGDIEVMAIATDDHAIHIREHAAILNDPIMRTTNPEVITRVLNHSQEHIKLLQETDPNLLGILDQTSLSPVGGTPNSPVQPPAPPAGAMNGMQEMSNPEAQELNPMDKARLPQPAKPAQSPDGKPVDPAQAMQIQQQGGQQQ